MSAINPDPRCARERCGHPSSRHILVKFELADSPREDCDARLVWRFLCRSGLRCSCYSFMLERIPQTD